MTSRASCYKDWYKTSRAGNYIDWGKSPNGRQARYAITLATYNFTIKYRAGKTNPVDTPSRRPLGVGGPLEDTMLPLL
jgi:hypothetical protein